LFFIRIVIGKNTLAFELPDWLIFIIKVMIKTKFVCFIVIFGILSHPIHSQTDSLRNGKVKSYKLYYSSDLDMVLRVEHWAGWHLCLFKQLGGSINYKLNILKNKNVPAIITMTETAFCSQRLFKFNFSNPGKGVFNLQ